MDDWETEGVTGAGNKSVGRLVLVTGANGFIGRRLCRELKDAGYRVRGSLRQHQADGDDAIDYRISGPITGQTQWRPILEDVDLVVHLAARVHRKEAPSPVVEQAYLETNVAATRRLAECAADAKVSRFIFLSSIAAGLAEPTGNMRTTTPYQRSKLAAEKALTEVGDTLGLNWLALRPPLVYGVGAPGNFGLLLRAIESGWPLPLASLQNRRSTLYLGNLTSALLRALESPIESGQVLPLCDGPPQSTAKLAKAVAVAKGRPARLFPCPPLILRWALQVLGRSQAAESLTGDLVIDNHAIESALGWRAPYTISQALRESFA